MNLCIFAPNFGLSESVLFTCTDAPVPVCPARLEGKVHLTKLTCSAKPQHRNLSLFTCFHLKTKSKKLHHREHRFAKNKTKQNFPKLRKISCAWRMAHMPLSCGPFRSRGQNRDVPWPLGGGARHGRMKRDSSAALQSCGREPVLLAAWERDLQGQATQDLGTTQDVVIPLA